VLPVAVLRISSSKTNQAFWSTSWPPESDQLSFSAATAW
jgi:hypothetical protein